MFNFLGGEIIMITNENKLLLELCKFNYPNKNEIERLLSCELDYSYLLGKILMNRIGGIAFYSLKSLKDDEIIKKIDREFINSLKSVYEYNCLQTKTYINNVKYVCSIINQTKIKYSVLKGAYLSMLYPSGLRTSNDIDILLSENDISESSIALKSNGFLQGYVNNGVFKEASRREIIFSKINRGETVPFVKKRGRTFIEVDLNFSLDAKPENSKLVEKIFQNFNLLENKHIPVLNIEDFFIHLCIHLYKEASGLFWVKRSSDLLLYKFVDIYYFIENYFVSSIIKTLLNRILKLKLNKECYYVLYYTRLIFNLKNEYLDNLIIKIKPENTEFMNKIYDFEQKIIYQYNMSFIDWFFCNKKENYLNEIKYDE